MPEPLFPVLLIAPDGTPWEVGNPTELARLSVDGYRLARPTPGVNLAVWERPVLAAGGERNVSVRRAAAVMVDPIPVDGDAEADGSAPDPEPAAESVAPRPVPGEQPRRSTRTRNREQG